MGRWKRPTRTNWENNNSGSEHGAKQSHQTPCVILQRVEQNLKIHMEVQTPDSQSNSELKEHCWRYRRNCVQLKITKYY